MCCAANERQSTCGSRSLLDGHRATFGITMRQKQTHSTDPVPASPEAPAPRLNTALHARLMAEGSAKPSTYASAMAALGKIRQQRKSGS